MITNDLQTRPSQETQFVLFFFPFGLFDQGLISTMVAQHNLPTLTSELKEKIKKSSLSWTAQANILLLSDYLLLWLLAVLEFACWDTRCHILHQLWNHSNSVSVQILNIYIDCPEGGIEPSHSKSILWFNVFAEQTFAVSLLFKVVLWQTYHYVLHILFFFLTKIHSSLFTVSMRVQRRVV